MSEPFMGEIRMVGFNFAPRNWAFCDGQLLSINQNQALYAIIGTAYGGDGQTTMALPDLRGRVPIHASGTYPVGSRGGSEQETLLVTHMPAHTHTIAAASSAGSADSLSGGRPASAAREAYGDLQDGVAMSSRTGATGGALPHTNVQPFTTINFCIALAGLFPSRD